MTCWNSTLVFHQFATSVHSSEKEAHNELFKQIQNFKTEIKFPKRKAYGWVNKNQECFTKWKRNIFGFLHRYNIPQESRSNNIVLTLMHRLAEPDQENCCSKLLLLYFNESIQKMTGGTPEVRSDKSLTLLTTDI